MLTKHRERIQKFRETNRLKHIYKKELDKGCFSHSDAYYDSKDLPRRIVSDEFLKDKAYEVSINPKYDRYQRGLVSMVYEFFDKKTRLGANMNEKLAKELHKPVIKKIKRGKAYARFKRESLCQIYLKWDYYRCLIIYYVS